MKFIKLFEDFSSDDKIGEIEDYFLELSDHSRDDLPISVEVEDHIVSKTWGDKAKKVGIKGYRISIKFDFYDQLFVKKIVDNAIIRLSNEYTIHFSRISKQGNGYNRKELPVNGTDRTTFVSDPIWKWIITISPKRIMESVNKRDFSNLHIYDIEDCFMDGLDDGTIKISHLFNDESSLPSSIFSKRHDIVNLFNNDRFLYFPPIINFVIDISIDVTPYSVCNIDIKRNIKQYLQRLYNAFDVNIFIQMRSSDSVIFIQPKSKSIKESIENDGKSTLLIIDVQKSFSKFFTKKYLSELNKYCKNFTDVYQIFDNHHDGKNPDKDYLYDENPDIENKSDLYKFNNQKDIIEKRYNYDVDADFYKKILSKETYNIVKSKEDKGQLKRGDYFITTENTIIVYIGNNHIWYHCPIKLYNLFIKLKGKDVVMVGGSDKECFLDVEVTAKSLGVNVIRDQKFIYSADHCPIK